MSIHYAINCDQVTEKKPESLKRGLEDPHRSTHHSSKKIRISHCAKPTTADRKEDRLHHSSNGVSSTTDISDKKENIDGECHCQIIIFCYLGNYYKKNFGCLFRLSRFCHSTLKALVWKNKTRMCLFKLKQIIQNAFIMISDTVDSTSDIPEYMR